MDDFAGMGRAWMAGTEMSYILETALRRIAEVLDFSWLEKPPVWLLGGSCGLLLHGVPLNAPPADIDLYADLEDSILLHQALCGYSVDGGPVEDFSGNCFSLRSRYFIGDTKVELVCGFQIGCPPLCYTTGVHSLLQYAPLSDIKGNGVLRLMPLAHELLFNLLRGRMDRCRMIASRMQGDLHLHTPLLQELIEYSRLDESCHKQLSQLLMDPSLHPAATEIRKEAAL